MKFDELSNKVIGSCIDVHKALGPGLLESAYSTCLAYELTDRGIAFTKESPLPISYREVQLDCGYRLDFVVEKELIVELKAVETLLPIHDAQLITYLKLSGIRTGLLINFNVRMLKDGVKRIVL